MAFYSDQMFYARTLVPLLQQTGTGTLAAGTGAITETGASVAPGSLPQYPRLTAINSITVGVILPPAAGVTGGKLVGLNGTATFAVATIGTNTAGVYVTAAMTVANSTFTATSGPTFNFVGTATSAVSLSAGQYNIWAEQQEAYSSAD